MAEMEHATLLLSAQVEEVLHPGHVHHLSVKITIQSFGYSDF